MTKREVTPEDGLSTGTQCGIAAFFLGLPLVGMGAEMLLGWGEPAIFLAAGLAGAAGVGTKVLVDGRAGQSAAANQIMQRLGLDRLQGANWRALLEPVIDAETAPGLPSLSLPVPEEPTTQIGQAENEDLFTHEERSGEVPGIERITVDQMVEHTVYNSYDVYLGRSLTRPGNKAVKINFYKRHIKLIGASQHGKSSMAAALLEAITRTHDNEHVLLALLDLEHKTSRLFANVAHIAELYVGEKIVDLHARSYEEVLERLELICELIDYRYTLSEQELDALPILIVYLEEFIDLKDYFKKKASATGKDEREQAEQQYSRLVYCIKKIAARGLKVLVQFLMCAQVDYRDDDLQEALINVTSGMSFCVRPSAAKAAGFYQNELITRNAKEGKVGQCVVEMPDCKDLILAPEYNLKDKLRAKERVYKKAAPVNVEMGISRGVNSPGNGSTGPMEPLPLNPHLRLLENGQAERETPGEIPAQGNVSAEIRETIKRLADAGVRHNVIAKAVKLDGRKYTIYKQVCLEEGIKIEKEA